MRALQNSTRCILFCVLLAACSGDAPAGHNAFRGGCDTAITGKYRSGENLQSTTMLDISVDCKYRLDFSGCGGRYSEEGVLTMSLENPRVALAEVVQRSKETATVVSLDGKVVRFVEWDGRQYAVLEEQLCKFVDDVNAGYEPRGTCNGAWLLREGDWDKECLGIPNLSGSNCGLLTGALSGEIILRAGSRGGWVNLGRNDGVVAGMRLWLIGYPTSPKVVAAGGPRVMDIPLLVAEVEETRSRIGYATDSAILEPLGLGQRVSSRPLSDAGLTR